MIKIEISNKEKIKGDYFKLLKDLIQERARLLRISLKHLNGSSINITISDHKKYKYITKGIVNKLSPSIKNKIKKFEERNYLNTVQNYLKTNSSDLTNVSFTGLFLFLNDILSNKNDLLKDILVCEASDLSKTNTDILTYYNISTTEDLQILKYVFDYENNSINSEIKSFFRSNNFVDYCPYCNLTEVKFRSTQEGTQIATSHELDHFFSKSEHPLLACSFFNLIPSDSMCNGPGNKGKIQFTDEYHLNPYIRGFNRDLTFIPILKGSYVSNIDMQINVAKGSKIRKQMLGSLQEIHEDIHSQKKHQEGNVNVFKLHSKYEDRKKEAQNVLDCIRAKDNGMSALKNFFKKMKSLDQQEVYLSWYEKKTQTSFNPKEFNKERFSKLKRDIHDYYYELNSKKRNNFIKELIDKYV